jgi:prevent-host-death family protein
MEKISVTALVKNFDKILEKVEKGKTFLITRYNKPVAYLMPCDEYEKMKKACECKCGKKKKS